MPVAETNPRRALLVGLAAIVFALGLLAVVVVANGSGGGGGGGNFDTLRVDDLIDRQRDDGVPTCFNDPISGNRPICVYHTGPNRNEGWVAYDAQVDQCGFETLTPEATELVDSCTGEAYPFTGEGLPQYEVEVVDGRLSIALVEQDDTTTTSTAPTTSTTRSG
jgi:hypothetical protein